MKILRFHGSAETNVSDAVVRERIATIVGPTDSVCLVDAVRNAIQVVVHDNDLDQLESMRLALDAMGLIEADSRLADFMQRTRERVRTVVAYLEGKQRRS